MVTRKMAAIASIIAIPLALAVVGGAQSQPPTVYVVPADSEFRPVETPISASPSVYVRPHTVKPHHRVVSTPSLTTQKQIKPRQKPLYSVTTRSLSGTATYYAYVPGGAAAGYELRRAIGSSWRGKHVQVCFNGRCVTVILSDYEASTNTSKIIDLDTRSFTGLVGSGGISMGVARVTVRW